MIPSWAVPAIEGIPEAVQAASKAATQAAKDAVQSVVAVGSSSPTSAEKVLLSLTANHGSLVTVEYNCDSANGFPRAACVFLLTMLTVCSPDLSFK